jgi:thioester reductase-like protein
VFIIKLGVIVKNNQLKSWLLQAIHRTYPDIDLTCLQEENKKEQIEANVKKLQEDYRKEQAAIEPKKEPSIQDLMKSIMYKSFPTE